MNRIIQTFCENNSLDYGIIDNKPLITNEICDKVPFINYSLEERTNPLLSMSTCKTILVFLMPYKINTFDDITKPNISSPNLYYDYHKVFTNKLKNLVDTLLESINFEYKIFVDTGKLIERELAVKAGLGFFSKNTNIISEKFGSACFIGYILTDYNFELTNKKVSNKCGQCSLCVKKCPTKAIKGDYTIDRNRCLSNLTQQKGDVLQEDKKLFSNKIYGCNECVKICPCNKGSLYYEEHTLTFDDFLNNTNSEFKEKFFNTGFFWRGNKVIKRNAQIGSINSLEIGDDFFGNME